MNKIANNDMEILELAHKALDDKFGEDIKIIDIRSISILADYFIIATGTSPNQIKAMSDEVSKKLYENGINLKQTEGYAGANWILLDFGSMIIHIFDKENRNFYSLERVWGDAPTIVFENK